MNTPFLTEWLGPVALVALLSLAWALAEIVQTFAGDLRRTVRAGWTWFFVLGHLVTAPLVYAVVRTFLLQDGSPWRVALIAGLGWQVLLRTRANLIQPIQGGGEGVPLLALVDLYDRFQRFCRTQINQSLLERRMRLLEKALHLPEETLEHQVHLLLFASKVATPTRRRAFWRRCKGNPTSGGASCCWPPTCSTKAGSTPSRRGLTLRTRRGKRKRSPPGKSSRSRP